MFCFGKRADRRVPVRSSAYCRGPTNFLTLGVEYYKKPLEPRRQHARCKRLMAISTQPKHTYALYLIFIVVYTAGHELQGAHSHP
jgi:hypothetical protein